MVARGIHRADKPLQMNQQMRRFAEAYVLCNSGAEAAVKAGYARSNAPSRASHLLARPDVQTYLEELRERGTRKAVKSLEDVVAELTKIGFANAGDFVARNHDGSRRMNWAAFDDPNKTAAIASLAFEEEEIEGPEGARAVLRRGKVTFWNKATALVDLGTHLGGFRGATETPVPGRNLIQATDLGPLEVVRRLGLMLALAANRAERKQP